MSSALLVDSCSTNDAMVDIQLSKLNPNHLLLYGKLIYICKLLCTYFEFNCPKCVKSYGDGIERTRDSVAFWIATPKRLQTFKENMQLLSINYSKQLMLWIQRCFFLSFATNRPSFYLNTN